MKIWFLIEIIYPYFIFEYALIRMIFFPTVMENTEPLIL